MTIDVQHDQVVDLVSSAICPTHHMMDIPIIMVLEQLLTDQTSMLLARPDHPQFTAV